MKLRMGQGIDAHRFVKGRPLFLGGVKIDHTQGLEGHSDADALLHAMCDAVLGALALGDIGKHFPDTDPIYRGRESAYFLREAARMAAERGFRVANVDSTVVTEQPMIGPHIENMRRNVSGILGIDLDRVSIKATRPENMGSLGRGEGLVALAVVLLEA